MRPWLYLDTARLGQMSPAAQHAQADFARFAGELGAAIQLEDLLRDGLQGCGSAIQREFPGLASWQGIANLKRSLRRLARLDEGLPMLLAARSAELMKLAAILLCQPCRNILVTDLGWKPYHRILDSECRRTSRRFTVVSLADDILRGGLNVDDVADRVRTAFAANRCDGLFLTAVNHCGVRLPVGRIVSSIRQECRFVVVDGAQDFCHVGLDVPRNCCDLYLAGCHKWLGGYHPLGIALYGRHRTRRRINAVLQRALETMRVDDPLMRFVHGIENGDECLADAGETVNLSSLLSCGGAAHDAAKNDRGPGIAARMSNAKQVSRIATEAGWQCIEPDESLRSGILLLEATSVAARIRSGEPTRRAFADFGVGLSVYQGGRLRLSMPLSPLSTHELDLLGTALRRLS